MAAARIILDGDKVRAGSWIRYAKSRLWLMKQGMELSGKKQEQRTYLLPKDNTRIFISSVFEQDTIMILVGGGRALIICHVGSTTGEYIKKYLDMEGNEMSPDGWRLTDDGKYGIIWDGIPKDDPDDYGYIVSGNGINVPYSNGGVPAKLQSGNDVRFILNQAVEDERFIAMSWTVVWGGTTPPAYNYTYGFLYQADSLSFAPYKIYNTKPYFSRYYAIKKENGDIEQGIISLNIVWAGMDTTLYYQGYLSDNFRDSIPMIKRIYKTRLSDRVRSYATIGEYSDANQAIIASLHFSAGLEQVIIRAKSFLWSGSKMAEPVRKENYDMGSLSQKEIAETYHRCSNPLSETCYMLDAATISGRTFNGQGFVTNTGQSTISNDIKLPYAITKGGKLTYIRMQKDTEFNQHNVGVYVADELIEESGWQNVVRLFDEDPVGTPNREIAEWNAPLLIRQTGYRILHAHHDDRFDAAVFEKVIYTGYETELLPYKAYRAAPIYDYCQVRRTLIKSTTYYFVAVNGHITKLPYECNNREYRATVVSALYSGTPIPSVFAHIVSYPYLDIGYDKEGNVLTEDNNNLTRIFTDSTQGYLLIGFDVFPVKFRHELVYDAHDNLTLDYKTVIAPFPPSSDGVYSEVKDRKWLLFGSSGDYKEINPPKYKDSGGIYKHYNRVNGLCMIGEA